MDELIPDPRLEDREHLRGEPRLQRMCPEGPGGDPKGPEYRPDDEESSGPRLFLSRPRRPLNNAKPFSWRFAHSTVLQSAKTSVFPGASANSGKGNGGMPVVDMPPFRSR